MTRWGRLVAAVVSVFAIALTIGPLVGGASGDELAWSTASELSLPTGAATTPDADLYALACPSQGNCVAGGIFRGSTGYDPMVASQSTGTWAGATEVALPSNAIGAGEQNSSIGGVACTSPGNCVAVGDYEVVTSYDYDPMVATETNGSWATAVALTPPSTPEPSDNQNAHLNGVTCTSPGNCVAVGNYEDSSDDGQAMIVTETGGTWNPATEVSVPSDAATTPNGALKAVTCTSSGNCVAVGTYTNSSSEQEAMVVTETNGTWAQASVVAPPTNAAGDAYALLTGVSCPSQGNCVAVGNYLSQATPSNKDEVMEATETSSSWGPASEITAPTDDNTGAYLISLSSVSCPSQGNCVATGSYYNSADQFQAMTGTESGGMWGQAVEFDDLPSNALTGVVDNTSQDASLDSVVCVTSSDCTAVGTYVDDNEKTQAMMVSTQASSTPTAPAITSPSSTTFTAGAAGSFTVDASGYPGGPTLTLSDGGASLPSGVTFVDNGDGTATLSGTPAVGSQGSYPFTITAANSVSPDATQSFTLTVVAAGTVPPATVSTDSASDVTATTASLNWTVQPAGHDLYYYNLVCQPPRGGGAAVQLTTTTPAGTVPADNGAHPLATPITGLRPGTTYTCGLSMGDNTGHSFESYPAVEDVTTLTPTFAGFSVAPLVTTAQATWDVNPEGDSLASYSVACSSSSGNANAGASITSAVIPADEASHPLTVALAKLAPGGDYACILSLTDADGLTFNDAPHTVLTGSVDVPGTTFSSGAFIAIGGSCGGSSGTVCAGSGEDVAGSSEIKHSRVLARPASVGSVVLGHFKFRIKAHHHATIKFEMTKAGRKLLLKHHKLVTTLIITVTVHGKKVTTRTLLTIVYRKP
jgi:hypothetical protein